MRVLRRIGADQRGNSVVELALVMPILATLLIGIVDISRAYSAKLALEQAAQRTIELMQRSSYTITDNSIYETDTETAAGTGSNATITNWLECNNNGVALNYTTGTCTAGQPYARYALITVTKPFAPTIRSRFLPGANAGTYTITARAGIRTQ